MAAAAGGSAAEEFPPIKSLALIGDCGSAALVSRNGTVEWLCWPRFDSPSLFSSLLDRRLGGSFRVGPAAEAEGERRYVGETAVLETVFRTPGGVLRLRDCMAVVSSDAVGALWPEHEILREVACLDGEVEVALRCAPRFDYGDRPVRAEARGPLGVFFQHRGSVVVLRSDLPLGVEGPAAAGGERLRAGDRRWVSLAYDEDEPATVAPLGEEADRRLGRTLDYWRAWSSRCDYDGPHRDAVVRSALTLKLMTAAAFGAVVAAPTTSLPERLGGVRNWDYRYCWLRDACFTLRALFELGYTEEGAAFFSWLLYTAHQSRTELRVLYSLMGGSPGKERELPHLSGYRGSRPVRVGNAAETQLQLDIYGEIVAAAYHYVRRGGRLTASSGRLLRRLGERVCALWQEPDQGIWEMRSAPQRHVYSAAMCAVALERLTAMAEQGHLRVPARRFARVGAEIRAAIERHGRCAASGSYVSVFGGGDVDASLLLLGLYGYVDPDDAGMRATFERIQAELSLGDCGLLRRYPHDTDDGLPLGEGAFGICSFWAVEYLARTGRVAEAERQFTHLCSYANDVGLFAEEIDPRDGQALGNFPQAFTHVGLVSAALAIDEARGKRPEASVGGSGPIAPRGSGTPAGQETIP
jgi:GH15 family glucan-1,4-alpha-glucosidase